MVDWIKCYALWSLSTGFMFFLSAFFCKYVVEKHECDWMGLVSFKQESVFFCVVLWGSPFTTIKINSRPELELLNDDRKTSPNDNSVCHNTCSGYDRHLWSCENNSTDLSPERNNEGSKKTKHITKSRKQLQNVWQTKEVIDHLVKKCRGKPGFHLLHYVPNLWTKLQLHRLKCFMHVYIYKHVGVHR